MHNEELQGLKVSDSGRRSSVAESDRDASAMAAKSDARCSRADCLALREELEILRGDHADLERENETLHDRVASLEGELSTVSARLRSDAAVASEQLAAKDAQLQALGDAVAALQAQLQQSKARANETTATAADKRQDSELQEECAALRGKNAALEAALRETRSALARETSSSAHAAQAVARIQQESKDKRDELYEALKENEMLRQERSELHAALQKISEVALDYEATIKALHAQQREYAASIDEQTVEIAQLQLKLEQQERDNETLAAKLLEMDARESDVDALVRELRTKSEMEKVVLRAELDALRTKAAQLEEQLGAHKTQQTQQRQSGLPPPQQQQQSSDGDVAALERQLEALEELRLQDKAALEDQRATIAQLQSDLATLSEHVAARPDAAASDAQAQAQAARHQSVQQENEALQRRLKEQRDVVRALELRQTQLERELVDAQTWNAKYEAGAGLEDVLAFQKKLRRELETQQRQNQRLREQLNAQTEAAGRLHAAFERLKRDAGLPPEFAYDDLAVDAALRGELAVQQAVMAQMELQLQELESERVRLLQRLREQAKRVGGSLFEALGLTTEQWQQVEEFVDRVKRTPEVAARWLLEQPVETTTLATAASGGERDGDAVLRLEREVERLREELSRSQQEDPQQQRVKERVSVATMTATVATETTGTAPSPTLRSPSARAVALASSSSEAPQPPPPASGPSPEELAQAIAQALEARLALRPTAPASASASASRREAESKPTPPADASLLFASDDAMAQQLDVLQELQLLLDDYATLEAQNATLRERLAGHDRALQSVLDQQRVAYEHVFHAQDAHAQDKRRWALEMDELRAQLRDAERRCEAAPANGGDAGGSGSGSEAPTRRLAAVEVEHAALQRAHRVLEQELQLSTQHAARLEREWLDMERALKCRVLYLESWRRGALDRLQRLERALHDSVARPQRDPADRADGADGADGDAEQLKATRQQEATLALREALADCHARYLALLPLPAELSRLQHEHALLVAMTTTTTTTTAVTKAPALEATATQRIEELERQLAGAMERVRELEAARVDGVIAAASAIDRSESPPPHVAALRQENALLLERVAELEQQYESLARECERHEDVAALAASQAHALSQRLTSASAATDQQQQQLRELQLAHVTSTYQLFARRYDDAVDAQQRSALRQQQLEMALELQARDAGARDEQQRERLAVLDAAITRVRERDWAARHAAWDAFQRRLDALEREMAQAQERRRALEHELQAKQLSLARDGPPDAAVVGRLQRRIDALETRERVLVGQLEAALAGGSSKATTAKQAQPQPSLRRELAEMKRLNEELVRQLEAQRQRVAELLAAQAELETAKRQAQRALEDATLELQTLRARGDGPSESGKAQSETPPSSPLMRRKVGLYEQDQAALQQAAQATIASLKLLVDEKNAALSAYERQARERQLEARESKVADRRAAAALHKQLYEENQRMIAEQRDAMATIHALEASGRDQRALQAAEQRHDAALREWKQAEVALQAARQRTRELEAELAARQQERDLAEARAGEALEEIVLLQQRAEDAAAERARVDTALATAKRELRAREDKMQLLRDALVKLKDEFLKAEDRHAMALVKAQQQQQQQQSKRRKQQEQEQNQQEQERETSEDQERLREQVTLLQEKLALAKASETRLRKQLGARARAKAATAAAAEEEELEGKKRKAKTEDGEAALQREVERLKAALKDRVVSDARVVEELEKKLRVLTAQNLALREAAAPARDDKSLPPTQQQQQEERREPERRRAVAAWEAEKRMQRRVDALTLRIKEQQSELERRAAENEAQRARVTQLEKQLADLQRAATAARAAMQPAAAAAAAPASAAASSPSSSGDVDDLRRQNAFLQETLTLKRSEWEQQLLAQRDAYEAQLERLRTQLVRQRGAAMTQGDREPADAALEREERAFVVAEELREELSARAEELREKERALVERDARLLDTELELESLRVEYQRLQRKAAAAAATTAAAPSSSSNAAAGGARSRARGLRATPQERLELEEVIENMKKVIEKLRRENERLRAHAASATPPEKHAALRRQLRETREALQSTTRELDALRLEAAELKQDKLRLQQRVRELSSRREPEATEAEDAARALALAEKDRELRALRAAVAERDARIRELRARQEETEQDTRMEALERENARLREELGAFDQDFFEEIEDLKYKYAQALRAKQRLETRLRLVPQDAGAGAASPPRADHAA
ncbi:hypothetical protein P43SY_010114 [Pythium insidiosum]|uniref:Centrosome-associated protein n=1 Tax=Pythium insidiosum TaxID=114742 RepID=A0AAD5LA41_PYTIN|nr:hypothetical protein P43SY_010114 [Pythium insidiosum]